MPVRRLPLAAALLGLCLPGAFARAGDRAMSDAQSPMMPPVGPSIGVSPAPAAAASGVAPMLTLERVFASPSLNGPAPRLPRLSPDGAWLAVLRNRPEDRERYDLWGYERGANGGGGQWRMLVDSTRLSGGPQPQAENLSEAEKMQRERLRIGDLKGIVSYAWSEDGKSLLVPIDGDLWLAGLDGSLRRIEGLGGADGAGVGALNAELSGKGRYLSFARDRRLWVRDLSMPEGLARPVTPEESEAKVHWGEAEFVAQEEMGRMKGVWWAPDDSRLAVERFDEAQVAEVTRAAIGAMGTTTFTQAYPLAGSANAEVSLWVMRPDGSERVRVGLGADADIYLARVDWAPDGSTLYVQRQTRAQDRLDMLAVDPASGAAHVLFSEAAAPGHWINLSNSYRFLKDGSLIWWSERDLFGHLYHATWEGHGPVHWRQLTHGHWMVADLAGVDEAGGRLFFTGTRDDVLAQQVYALDYVHGGEPVALGEPGYVHAASMDKAGRTLVIARSSPTQPPQVYLADASGKRIAWLEENRIEGEQGGLGHPWAPYAGAARPVEFGTITGPDGTQLHWRMIRPAMEPGKRYPVFFEHYGGPHAQTVTRAWAGALPQALVAKGYVWFELDNRGSAGRGVAFEKPIFHAMGGPEVEDQMAGLAFLKSLPFVDPAKIATYGWSYGGYMTLKLLEAHPGAFAAGIAGAPVTKWELYDTHYTERYLGDPRVVPEVYAGADVLDRAGAIRDPLLVIHGLADDNVVFEHSSALIARLQGEAVPFEMMLYPGYTHRVGGPKVGVHLWNTILDFLKRHGVTPP